WMPHLVQRLILWLQWLLLIRWSLLWDAFTLRPHLKPLALPMAGAGAVALACSSFSLKTWKQGQSTAPFTMLSAGGAGAAAYASWTVLLTQVGFGLWFSGALAGLSVLVALFCVCLKGYY
ncbi:hypothetical protein QJQ45_021104, partial [Haematococcus lacustris]